jgi:hypothetical protein
VRPLTVLNDTFRPGDTLSSGRFVLSGSDLDRSENTRHHVNVEKRCGVMRCLATRAWYWKTKQMLQLSEQKMVTKNREIE